MFPSSESLAAKDYSTSVYSSRAGETEQKLDTGNIEEAELSLRENGSLNYEVLSLFNCARNFLCHLSISFCNFFCSLEFCFRQFPKFLPNIIVPLFDFILVCQSSFSLYLLILWPCFFRKQELYQEGLSIKRETQKLHYMCLKGQMLLQSHQK